MKDLAEHKPAPRKFLEKIGDRDFELEEAKLDVFDDVMIWPGNPRLLAFVAEKHPDSEDELEAHLQQTPGYDGLKRSISDIGQLEHIYAWKRDGASKHLVLEGNTRVAILRELARRKKGRTDEGQFRYVKAKILPPEFSAEQRVVLLALIHVRGSGVRSWGRYIEAKFVYESTASISGRTPIMTVSEMARYMGKSISWVSRLRDAYQFSRKYVESLDSLDAEARAMEHFSVLEEIIKAPGFGPLLKDQTEEADALRAEVFDMVKNSVFKEYRDARYMKEFYADKDKWARLKTHEKHIAHLLAAEVAAAGPNTVQGRISSLYGQIERTLDRDPGALTHEDLEELQKCVGVLSSHVAGGVGMFRLKLQEFSKALQSASLEEIKKVTPEEYSQLTEGLDDFKARLKKHSSWMS